MEGRRIHKMSYLTITNYVLLGLICVVAVIGIIIINYFIIKRKNPQELISKIDEDMTSKVAQLNDTNKEKKSKKKDSQSPENKDPNIKAGSILLNFDRIINNMIVRDDGSLCSQVIQCSGINLDSMSDIEKASIEQAFIGLFNNVSFPLQIHIQTRALKYQDYSSICDQKIDYFEKQFKELVNDFNKLRKAPNENKHSLSTLLPQIQRRQKLFEYAKNLKQQMERVNEIDIIIQNTYYIIISCSAKDLGAYSNFKTQNVLDIASSELLNRSQIIIDSLIKCGIQAENLNSHQLVELLFNTFNSKEENLHKLKDLLNSGFYKLNSSSQN